MELVMPMKTTEWAMMIKNLKVTKKKMKTNLLMKSSILKLKMKMLIKRVRRRSLSQLLTGELTITLPLHSSLANSDKMITRSYGLFSSHMPRSSSWLCLYP